MAYKINSLYQPTVKRLKPQKKYLKTNMRKYTYLIIFVLIIQFLPIYSYGQSTPQQSKEDKKKAEQEQKAQEKQAKEDKKQQEKKAKEDAKTAKNSAPAFIEKSYDRFTDRTTIGFLTPTSKQNILEGIKLDLGVAVAYKGTVAPNNDRDTGASIILTYRLDGASQVRDKSLILLVDNTPIDFGQLKTATSSTRRFNARVTFTDVTLYAEVPLQTLRNLSNAQTIEGRFSGVEFQISPKFIPTVREFFKP